jgi:hypothetical protein
MSDETRDENVVAFMPRLPAAPEAKSEPEITEDTPVRQAEGFILRILRAGFHEAMTHIVTSQQRNNPTP